MGEENKRDEEHHWRPKMIGIKMSWTSGLRRNVKAVVFIGVGSNPTDIIAIHFCHIDRIAHPMLKLQHTQGHRQLAPFILKTHKCFSSRLVGKDNITLL